MSLPDATFDAALELIATGTTVTICSAEPANFAGIAAVALAEVTVSDSAGDFVIADGDTSGRKITLAEQTGIVPDTNGTATYLAIDDGATLLATCPITSQAITTLQTWAIPETKIVELRDPTYA